MLLINNNTLNRVMLIGEITDELKIHYISTSQLVIRFHLMTIESFYNIERKKHFIHRERHNIFIKNDLSEHYKKQLKKGDNIYLEGRIRNKKFNEQGQLRSFIEIHADHIIQFERKSNKSNVLLDI